MTLSTCILISCLSAVLAFNGSFNVHTVIPAKDNDYNKVL